ncbi:MAG TPA: DUF2325 domain-containing protein [Polyangiaceae bacterium]|nr:DUF2325 domain-containing protein [Polyangiaceae bacterium]
MTPNPAPTHRRNTVVIVGGKGGLEARYRETVEQNGFDCRYYEDRVPGKLGARNSTVALVIVIVSMVSHPLMARARELAGSAAPIVYLNSPSISAVRQTVTKHLVPAVG